MGFRYAKNTKPCISGETQCPYTETWYKQDYGSVSKPERIDSRTGAGDGDDGALGRASLVDGGAGQQVVDQLRQRPVELPERRLLEQEVRTLAGIFEQPERPLAAIVGGSKVSTKLELLENLIRKVDVLAIGGAMANTFLLAQGHDIGKSKCERDMAGTARQVLQAR